MQLETSSSKLASMASCFLAKDTAHFNLCSLESNSTKVTSSHSFENSESPLSPGAESSPVSNLCAQVVLSSPLRMQSMRKSTKAGHITRSGRRLSSDASLSLSDSKEEISSTAKPFKPKIVTRRYAEQLELAAAQTNSKKSVSPSNEDAGKKRRTQKRSSTGSLKHENDSSVLESPKDAKELGEPEKKRKLRSDKSEEAPLKLPGTAFKVCANCGTVADKTKAKKCRQCKKFFFNHWAKRCRIPPCPKCHFSRKSKPLESVPTVCERCGAQLPAEEGNDACKSERSSVDSNVSSKRMTYKVKDKSSSESGRRDSRSDDLSLASTTTSSTSPGSPSKFEDSKLFGEQSDMAPIANTAKSSDSAEPSEEKMEVYRVEEKFNESPKGGVEVVGAGSAGAVGHKNVESGPNGDELETVKESDISMSFCKDSNNRLNTKDEKQSSVQGMQKRCEQGEIMKGLSKNQAVQAEGQKGVVPVVREVSTDQRNPLHQIDPTGWHQLGSGLMMRADERGMTTEKHKMTTDRQDTAVGGVPAKFMNIEGVVGSYPRVSIHPLSDVATRSSGTKTPFIGGPTTLNAAAATTTTTHWPASTAHSFPVIPSIISAVPSSSTTSASSTASLQYASLASKLTLSSRGSVQPIEKSLKEHFERSLIGLSEGGTVQASSPVGYPASIGNRFSPVLKEHQNDTRPAERVGEGKVEMASVGKVDRLGQAGWSNSVAVSTLPVCAANKTAAASPTVSTARLSACYLPQAMSDVGSSSLPKFSYINPSPANFPAFLQALSNHYQRSAPENSTGSPQSPILLFPPVVSSILSPSLQSLAPIGSTPISLPGLPSTSNSSSSSLSTNATPAHDVPMSTLFKTQSAAGPPATSSTQVISSAQQNIAQGSKSAKCPVIVSPHSDLPLPDSKGRKMIAFPPTTAAPLLAGCSDVGTSSVGSKSSKEAPANSQADVFIVEKTSQLPLGLRTGQNSTGATGLFQGTSIQGQVVVSSQNPSFPHLNATASSPALSRVNTLVNYKSHVDGQSDNPFPPGHKLITSSQLLPKVVDSKGRVSPVVQPPSLVSIGASGTVTITRSYTLPQAPRVSIAVAPPPLQNIKEGLVGRSVPSTQQFSSTSYATPAKLEESSIKSFSNASVKSQAVLAGKRNSAPPLVHCSNSPSLADSQMDTKSEQFTSSRTVTVNIVSSTSPHLPACQKGPIQSGEQQKTMMGPSTGGQFNSISVSDRVRTSSAEYRSPVEGVLKGFDNYTPSVKVSDQKKAEGALQSNVASSSTSTEGILSDIPPPSQTSFQKLDLQASHSVNKIRVSLLKDNSNFDSSSTTASTTNHTSSHASSPTPPVSPLFPPSNTRMITKVYEFPLQLPGTTASPHLTMGQVVSLPSFSSIPSSSVASSCRVTSPISMNNFQPTSVTTATSVAPLPSLNIGHGVTAAVIKTSSSSQGPPGTKNVFKWPISTSTLPSWSNKATREDSSLGKTATTLRSVTEEGEELSNSDDTEEGSARTNGVGLQYRVYRNMEALEQHQGSKTLKGNSDGISSADEASQNASQSGTSSKKTNYRKILPNTLKTAATSSQATCTSSMRATSPSHSQVRSGVVTVQVCSSIPATLSLSSIIPPKISQSEAGEALGSESCGYVSSSSDTGANSADASSRVRRGGGGVMVTPLSPSVLPPGRTVAQIVTSSISAKDVS